MLEMIELETDRLKLRQWLPSDYAPFSRSNALALEPENMLDNNIVKWPK